MHTSNLQLPLDRWSLVDGVCYWWLVDGGGGRKEEENDESYH
jgi:hypothetical protein